MPAIDKNKPSAEWIAEVQRRFPCEPEVDRILTAKLKRRGGPGYSPVPLDKLVEGTRALIAANIGDDFEITDASWLSGGASKLQMFFNLTWDGSAEGHTKTPMVLRMEPAESISETSRLSEFAAIKALEGHIPVPPTYWVDGDGSFLPYPAIIYGFAQGVAKPTESTSNVTGVGTTMPEKIRSALGSQFVEHCALLHTFDIENADLGPIDRPASGDEAVLWQLDHWERVWEEDSGEDVPLMRLAMAWMRKNRPPCDHLSLIHGDFRTGNFLFTEYDNHITAWLDWEFAHIGDRHEDVSWSMNPVFGQYADDGKTLLIGGLMPREEFLAEYERISGLPIDQNRLDFYAIFNNYKAIAIVLATGTCIARNGKTHQDVLTAWLAGISYLLLDDLRVQLEGVL
ncbi:MAG: phosphotransferase family protein [Caenibius sp.]